MSLAQFDKSVSTRQKPLGMVRLASVIAFLFVVLPGWTFYYGTTIYLAGLSQETGCQAVLEQTTRGGAKSPRVALGSCNLLSGKRKGLEWYES